MLDKVDGQKRAQDRLRKPDFYQFKANMKFRIADVKLRLKTDVHSHHNH
jgi:hypothetical protein